MLDKKVSLETKFFNMNRKYLLCGFLPQTAIMALIVIVIVIHMIMERRHKKYSCKLFMMGKLFISLP